jgi:hypothetical protein
MYRMTVSIIDETFPLTPLYIHGDIRYDSLRNIIYVEGAWVYQWGENLCMLSEHMDKRVTQLSFDGTTAWILDLEKYIQHVNVSNASIVFNSC